MKIMLSGGRAICAGLYAWAMSAYCGAVLLDILYSRSPDQDVPAAQSAADFLLLFAALAILLAAAAVMFSWSTPAARDLFLASILCFVAVELLAPMLFAPLLEALRSGAAVRLAGSVLASLLAVAALWQLGASSSA